MFVFRSIALGLLGACFLLLATRQTVVKVERVPVLQPAPPTATIIDVAPGVDPAQLTELVHLQSDEHVTAVDDRPVSSDLDAGVVIASRDATSNRFVDVTVSSKLGQRRVLVLLH